MGDLSAPFRQDLAEGPADGEAVWVTASDGVRLRVGFWPKAEATGTIVIFSGRAEYLEKYGRMATDLTARGYAVATMDWRGQGMSDRSLADARIGHVGTFAEYQRDVDALFAFLAETDAPKPWYLVAHSMGGCIGLRALIRGLPVEKAVFSAPMWGIFVEPFLKPVALTLPWILGRLGRDSVLVPGAVPRSHVTETSFADNKLTTDDDQYAYMVRHAEGDDAFALGGPSVHWFGEAVLETEALFAAPRPKIPVLTFLGTDERIVSARKIHAMHENWPSARLRIIPGSRHEIMMEAPAHRDLFIDETDAFFRAP